MTAFLRKQILVLSLLALPLFSAAKFPGALSRFQLGYTFVMNSAELKNSMMNTLANIDTSYSDDFKTSAAFGVVAGTGFRLASLGKSTSLVLGVDFMYNMMTWKSKVKGFGMPGAMELNGVTAQMVLPIGLDLKFGGEANLTSTPRVSATVGAGVYPSYAATVIDDAPITFDPVFAVAPYVKAELGFYAGVEFKVRALYAIGNVNYLEYAKKESGSGFDSDVKVTLTGKSNLSLSILVMPFSYKWKTPEWWNTY